jgi:hypothetical protein
MSEKRFPPTICGHTTDAKGRDEYITIGDDRDSNLVSVDAVLVRRGKLSREERADENQL